MEKAEDGIFLTNAEVGIIGTMLDYAEILVRKGLHNFAVELDGRPGLMSEDHVVRDKGSVSIDYRVTEEEVIDNILCSGFILKGNSEGINNIFKGTTCGELYEKINEFRNLFTPES